MATITVHFVHAAMTLQSSIQMTTLHERYKRKKYHHSQFTEGHNFLLLNQSRMLQIMLILTVIFYVKSSRSKNKIISQFVYKISMLEMTKQLIVPVFWSMQYNLNSVVLFSNELYNLYRLFCSHYCFNIFKT